MIFLNKFKKLFKNLRIPVFFFFFFFLNKLGQRMKEQKIEFRVEVAQT